MSGHSPAKSKYIAFISYSSRDRRWARWLHKALESYSVPRELAGTNGRDGVVPARLYPIFRDRDELASSPNLDAPLMQALAESANLIVVCSPAAAQSKWVDREVLEFKRLGRSNHIHSVIVQGGEDGSPGNCFVPSLLHPLGEDGQLDLSTENVPLAADVRSEADGRSGALLKIIAGLAGVPLAVLTQREKAAARNRRRIWQAVSAILAILTIGVAVAVWYADKQGKVANSRLIPGIRVERLETIIDLSGWNETSQQDLDERRKVSAAVSINKFTVIRTHEHATEFVHIVGTTSGIAPEIQCNTCQVRPHNTGAAARAPLEWEIVYDLEDVPLDGEKEVEFRITFWNAFQSPSQWWGGFRILHSTEVAIYSLIFPEGKHPRTESIEYFYVASKPGKFTREQRVEVEKDGDERARKLTWLINNPLADRSYRVKWVWDQ